MNHFYRLSARTAWLALALSVASWPTPAAEENFTVANTFFLGSHLCRFPMPEMAELKADMENLKRHGFNLIKLQTHWAIDEPLEGQYDFARWEELIAHAEKLGLSVYVGLTCEQAPPWLYEKYPDCRMVGKNGAPVVYETFLTLPADGKPGPCFDHPGAMAAQKRYIRALVEALGKYPNVTVWNTWQEIAYWAESLIGQEVCYCPNTLQHFRYWLQTKYPGLDALNRAWGTNYRDWQHVAPNRGVAVGLGQDVDWRYFMANVHVAQTLRERYQTIKEADPLKRPVFAHKGSPAIGSGRDWTYARCQDFVGSSSYPAWGPFDGWDDDSAGEPARPNALRAEMWNKLALSYDYIRSANPQGHPVWAAEFQGGPVGTEFHKGRVPSPEDIRRWMLTVVGSGVNTISFWVTRAEIAGQENNGFSLLDSEGDTTPRFEEASRIGRALMNYPDIFGRPSRPQSQIGILIDEWNHAFCSGYYNTSRHLSYSVRGWYRLLWDLGIAVDFVAIEDVSAATAGQYKALVLPFPISLAEASAARLKSYVEAGGNLISEAAPGRMNEHGLCPRGEISPTMRDLFAVRQTRFQMVKEPNGGHRWMPGERTWGEFLDSLELEGVGPFQNHRVLANFYLQTFESQGSEPILRQGEAVAGVVNHAGKGRAWLLGTFIGHNGTAYRNEKTASFVAALMKQVDVPSEKRGKLLLRRRVGQNREAWLLTNPWEDEVIEHLEVGGWSRVTDLLSEPLPRSGQTVTIAVPGLDVRCIIVEN
ncbi:MAG: beta-galactosidase [bacterium]